MKEYNLEKIYRHDAMRIISQEKEVALIADNISVHDMNIICLFEENGYEIKLEKCKYRHGIKIILKQTEKDEKQIIKDFINKLAEKLSSIHSDDNSWCEYSADEFIDEMVDVAEKLMK